HGAAKYDTSWKRAIKYKCRRDQPKWLRQDDSVEGGAEVLIERRRTLESMNMQLRNFPSSTCCCSDPCQQWTGAGRRERESLHNRRPRRWRRRRISAAMSLFHGNPDTATRSPLDRSWSQKIPSGLPTMSLRATIRLIEKE